MSEPQNLTLASALKTLGKAADHLPEPALQWALDHWDIARPALTQVLARCAKDPENASDSDMITSFFALHLLAQKRETSVFPLLRALVKSPEGAPAIFDDGSAALTRVMVSLFDGDTAALRALALAPGIEFFARDAVFETLAFAAATGLIDRADTHAWLAAMPATFEDEAADPLDAPLGAWALAVARLGFDDLMPQVREIFAGLVEDGDEEEDDSGLEDLELIFKMAREEPDPLAVFTRDGIEPITDAIADLKRIEEMLLAADEEAENNEDEQGETAEPVVNQFRDVGRNDPCPCGSGKKFKVCHGAT